MVENYFTELAQSFTVENGNAMHGENTRMLEEKCFISQTF